MNDPLNRQVSRRRLLQSVGSIAPAAWLAACFGGSPAKPAATPTSVASGASVLPDESPTPSGPRVGGDLRIDVPADPLSLDPVFRNAVEGQRIYRLTNNQLLKYRDDRTLEPDLAAELPAVSPDGLTYTIKLRTGVKWHDGRPFEAADVKFTYEQMMKPENQAVWAAALSQVQSITAPDPQTIVIKLKGTYTPMMHKLAMLPIISSKIPYERDKTYGSSLIGTGPYRFLEWQRGTHVLLERNPEYFATGKPYFQKVMIKTVQEGAARITNLVNGVTMIVPEAPLNQLEIIKQRGGIVAVLEQSTARIFAFPSFQEGRPTRDVNFRLALSWAIDRQTIVDQVLNGQGVPASTYLSSGSLHFDEKLGKFFGGKPDLTKAHDYLTKAGGPPKRDLEIVVQNLAENLDVATILQQNLRALGISSKVTAEEIGAFLPRLLSGDYDLLITRSPAGSTAGFAPDYPYLGLLTGSASNFNKFSDDKMDDLLKKAVAAPEAQATAAWQAVQQRDVETVGQIQIVTARYVEAYHKSLQGYRPSALFMPFGVPDAWLGQAA